MDDNARLKLQQMIQANNVEDQTDLIRELKHSTILRQDVQRLVALKEIYAHDPDQLHLEAMVDCSFLFTYYTDIYNKIRKDELQLSILYKFLDVLEQIEQGTLDQHEGSFAVGTLLKELYIDSALKKAEKLEAEAAATPAIPAVEPIPIQWRQFKHLKPPLSRCT